MRIITVSDLHIGKKSLGNFGINIAKSLSQIDGDVLYFGGDLAEPNKEVPQKGWDNFKQGLELLAKSPALTKVFTLGNNDLEQLQYSKLTEHYDELRQLIGEFGFHLLDYAPNIVNNVAFVGNVGWYDGSLWWKFKGDPKGYPNDFKIIRETAHTYFREIEFRNKLPDNLTSELFYQHCKNRLTKHLDEMHSNESVDAVVLGVHFVPDKSFVKGDNPKYAFLNWYMGAEAHANHYQRDKVVLGFTGHTHRSDVRQVGRLNVHNLSGLEQPRVFDLKRVDVGSYEVKKVLDY